MHIEKFSNQIALIKIGNWKFAGIHGIVCPSRVTFPYSLTVDEILYMPLYKRGAWNAWKIKKLCTRTERAVAAVKRCQKKG